MVKPVNSTDNYSSRELTIRYYPGEIGDSSLYNMYEDDGKTFGTIGRGEFELLRISGMVQSEKNISIKMIRDGWDYNGMPRKRLIKLEIVGQKEDDKYEITINGSKIKKMKKESILGYYVDDKNRLNIQFSWDGTLTQINILRK